MKLTKSVIPLLGAIIVVGLANPIITSAMNPVTPVAEKPDTPEKSSPFRGIVGAVDTTANTLTVDTKLIYVMPSTKLLKAGKAITLGDIFAGDVVHGVARLALDGKSEASLVVVVGPTVAGKGKIPKAE